MTGLRYSPLHVTEFCGEMQGKFIVGRARLITVRKYFSFLLEYGAALDGLMGCRSSAIISLQLE